MIARVGGTELTLEEAKAAIDSSRDSFESRLHSYTSSWINTQILFQEAQRQGIRKSESFQKMLADAEQQLIVQEYIQQRVYNDSIIISENEMRAYFDNHSAEFFVREDMLKMNVITFSSRDRATAFTAVISQGSSWKETLENIMLDTSSFSGIVSFVTNKYYSQKTLYPAELWKVAITLSPNEVSFPVKTVLGYYVLQTLSMIKQGKPEEFDFAKDEIRERLLIEKRRQRYTDLVGTLRKQYNVEMLLPKFSQSDTTQVNTHE